MSFLYVLKLEHGMWYVGSTRDPMRRLAEHVAGEGAAWTRLHPPRGRYSELVEVMGVVGLAEDARVMQLMHVHGIDAVRGGTHSAVHLDDAVHRCLTLQLRHANDECLHCGRAGHYAAECGASGSDETSDETSDE